MRLAVFSVVALLADIWGVAYLFSLLHQSDWRGAPILFTAILVSVVCIVSFCFAMVNFFAERSAKE